MTGYSDDNNTITYKYDSEGLRASKTVNGVEVTYTYIGDKLVYQHSDNGTLKNELYFFYDSFGKLTHLKYYKNGTLHNYHIVTNSMGDVISIYNTGNELVANYEYDAWGNVVSIKDASGNVITDETNIAIINPIRYRGYYYDVETKLYYLQSRYYNPEIGRFLNADGYLTTGQGVLSYNMFAYCMNNPVNRFDVNGNWSMSNLLKVTVGAVAIVGLAVATVCTGGAVGVIAGAALTGAISGGAFGAISGAVSGAIEGGWQGAVDGACTGFMSGTLIGGATGALTSGLSMATGAVKVVGSAQKTGTTLHRAASNIEAGKMAMNPIKYSKVTLNRSLNTAGLSGRRMPDVIGIARNGSSKLIEVVSKSQTVNQMTAKCISMTQANPGATYSVIGWAAAISRFFN